MLLDITNRMQLPMVANESILYDAQGRIYRGAHPARAPSIFCRDRASDFVWVPQAKRMHQIVRIDFENCHFSLLLRGHIPLRHPLSPQAPKFCKTLMWVPPLLKNPGSAPDADMDVVLRNLFGPYTECNCTKIIQACYFRNVFMCMIYRLNNCVFTFASALWQDNACALRFWCLKCTNPKGWVHWNKCTNPKGWVHWKSIKIEAQVHYFVTILEHKVNAVINLIHTRRKQTF